MASYRKRHVKNKIRGIKPKKSILKRPWFWVVLLFILIISLIIYLLFFYAGFQVKNILISGNNKIETQDLYELVSDNVNTGLVDIGFYKLETKSIFLVDTAKIDKEILEKFPIIEKIKINKNLPQTLVLGVTERKPIGVFCSPKDEKEQCFLIDQNGIIFEPIAVAQEGATIVRQTLENRQLFTGEEVVAENIITAISKIKKSLKDNFQIDLEEALVTSPLRLNVKTNEDWQIYFNLDSSSDIDSQLVKLNLLLSGEILPENRKNLQYIDLRFKDRAYYK